MSDVEGGGDIRGVVVSHADLGAALVHAVESITGILGALVPVSNDGCNRATLDQRVHAAVGDAPCVVFVDLAGGSCFRSAARLTRDHAGLTVVAGVNLPMLIDFVFHRDLGLDGAVKHAVEAGSHGIRVVSS